MPGAIPCWFGTLVFFNVPVPEGLENVQSGLCLDVSREADLGWVGVRDVTVFSEKSAVGDADEMQRNTQFRQSRGSVAAENPPH